MAKVLKSVSRVIRIHHAVASISSNVVKRPLTIAQVHSAALFSTSTRVYKKHIPHGTEAPPIAEADAASDQKQDHKKAKEKFIQMKAVIDNNDLDIKIRKIRDWLQRGYHVKVKILLNQRNVEKSKKNSQAILKKMTDALEEVGKSPVPQFKDTDIYIADFKDIPIKTSA